MFVMRSSFKIYIRVLTSEAGMQKTTKLFATLALSLTAFAQTPSVKIVLPERVRLLKGQYVDLVLEVRNASSVSNLKVMAGSVRITREYQPQRNVDEFFPPSETITCFFPDSTKPEYSVRARRLSGGRVLLAMGTSKPGQTTGQVLLIREKELGNFYPWVITQLK